MSSDVQQIKSISLSQRSSGDQLNKSYSKHNVDETLMFDSSKALPSRADNKKQM